MEELSRINDLSPEKFADLCEKIEHLASEIDRKTKRGRLNKWIYYDPFKGRMVARNLLFTGGKIYEETKPGLYKLCDDLYQTNQSLTEQD